MIKIFKHGIIVGLAIVASFACKSTFSESEIAGVGKKQDIGYRIKKLHAIHEDLMNLFKTNNLGDCFSFAEMHADYFYTFAMMPCGDGRETTRDSSRFIYIDPDAIDRKQDEVRLYRDGLPIGEATITYADATFSVTVLELCTDVYAMNCQTAAESPFWGLTMLKVGDPEKNRYIQGLPTADDWKRQLNIKFSQIPFGYQGRVWFEREFAAAEEISAGRSLYQGNYLCRWYWNEKIQYRDAISGSPTVPNNPLEPVSSVRPIFTGRWLPKWTQQNQNQNQLPVQEVTPQGIRTNLGFIRDTDESSWSFLTVTKPENGSLSAQPIGVAQAGSARTTFANVDDQHRALHLKVNSYRILIKQTEQSGAPYRWAECIFE